MRVRIFRLDGFRALDVVVERRRAGVQNEQLVVVGDCQNILHGLVVRRRIHQLASGDQRGRLREPGGKPIRSDLTFRLIPRARAAVKPIERGWTEE